MSMSNCGGGILVIRSRHDINDKAKPAKDGDGKPRALASSDKSRKAPGMGVKSMNQIRSKRAAGLAFTAGVLAPVWAVIQSNDRFTTDHQNGPLTGKKGEKSYD